MTEEPLVSLVGEVVLENDWVLKWQSASRKSQAGRGGSHSNCLVRAGRRKWKLSGFF